MKRFENYFTKSRDRETVYRRYTVFYYLRKAKGMTLKEIGNASGFDHATVIHGIKQFENMTSVKDKEFMRITKDIGGNLLPDIYLSKKNIDLKLEQKINIELQRMGVDASDKFGIIGSIGDRVFTVDGFKQFINTFL